MATQRRSTEVVGEQSDLSPARGPVGQGMGHTALCIGGTPRVTVPRARLS